MVNDPGGQRVEPGGMWGLIAALPVALALSVGYGLTLAPGVTWANDGADSGDLMTAVATLGVPHPTGYPTYVLLARAYLLLPLGEAAHQQAAFSAACAVAAALVVAAIVRSIGAGRGWHGAAAGALAALWLGWSPLFWSQAVITEVYSLHALFCAGLWWCSARAMRPEVTAWGWPNRAAGALAGLALGNHLTAIFPAMGLVGVVALCGPRLGRLRRLGGTVLWAGVGLLVYLYLPLRAGAATPASWGDPSTVGGLRQLVSGEIYHGLAFHVSTAQLAERLGRLARLPYAEFGAVGLGLGLWGLLRAPSRLWCLRAAMALVALATAIFALWYGIRDWHLYLIPVCLTVAVWLGVGASDVLGRAATHPLRAALLTTALAVSLALRVPLAAAMADASRDMGAIQFASETLSQAPPSAILLTGADRDTFPLWYYHVAVGVRHDLMVVAGPLLPFDWYQAHLRAAYPALNIPTGLASGWDVALLARNPGRPFCWTQPEHASPLRCALDR